VGFFTNEEYTTNSDGLVIHDGTWTYKIPTVDTIPKQFNVEMFNSAPDQKRVLSSKGERLSLSAQCFVLIPNPSKLLSFLGN
jgi:xanthine dehydrogenase molybdopterin-binding subunit B